MSRGQPQVPGEEELVIDECEKSAQQHNGGECNTHVNLFRLHDLNVLFECSVDQYDVASGKTFQISPKCEYQCSLGFEQFSIVDLCQLWWDSKVANTDWIVCSRIDILNDVITQNDQYTRDVLCPPGCPYEPRYFSNQLYHIFKELLSLPCGEYILEHPVAENCIKIFGEDCEQGSDGMERSDDCREGNDSAIERVDAANVQNESCAVTYQTIYKTTIRTKDLIAEYASPWLPIDTAILSEKFMKNRWIPCLFSQFNSPRMMARKKVKKAKIQSKQCEATSNVRQLSADIDVVCPVTNRKVTSYEEEQF